MTPRMGRITIIMVGWSVNWRLTPLAWTNYNPLGLAQPLTVNTPPGALLSFIVPEYEFPFFVKVTVLQELPPGQF